MTPALLHLELILNFHTLNQEKMKIEQLTKFKSQTALEICQHFELQDAKELLNEKIVSVEFLQLLIDDKMFVDAIKFVAFGLPNREAVWWACICAKNSIDENNQQDLDAYNKAKKWVLESNDENRYAAQTRAEKLNFATPAAWAAMAAFWSGGSITPAGQPAVEPDPTLCAQAVAGCVQLAAVIKEPEKSQQKFEKFLLQGVHIANGGNGEID